MVNLIGLITSISSSVWSTNDDYYFSTSGAPIIELGIMLPKEQRGIFHLRKLIIFGEEYTYGNSKHEAYHPDENEAYHRFDHTVLNEAGVDSLVKIKTPLYRTIGYDSIEKFNDNVGDILNDFLNAEVAYAFLRDNSVVLLSELKRINEEPSEHEKEILETLRLKGIAEVKLSYFRDLLEEKH